MHPGHSVEEGGKCEAPRMNLGTSTWSRARVDLTAEKTAEWTEPAEMQELRAAREAEKEGDSRFGAWVTHIGEFGAENGRWDKLSFAQAVFGTPMGQ